VPVPVEVLPLPDVPVPVVPLPDVLPVPEVLPLPDVLVEPLTLPLVEPLVELEFEPVLIESDSLDEPLAEPLSAEAQPMMPTPSAAATANASRCFIRSSPRRAATGEKGK
jgi:hypothetical protein